MFVCLSMPHISPVSLSYTMRRCLRMQGWENDLHSCCQAHTVTHLPVFRVCFDQKDIKLVNVLQVNEGMKMVTEEHCDCIISFGGGSPHDAAKGIAVLATNGGGAPCQGQSADIST